MTDYRIELQAFVDAAASFTEPALGHHKAWAEAVARARVALSMPESSASTVCPITPPPELVEEWANASAHEFDIATQAAQWGSDQELLACGNYLQHCAGWLPDDVTEFYNYRRPRPPSLKELALAALAAADGADHPVVCTVITADQHAIIRQALEQLDD